MVKIGFIGLGHLGITIAKRLINENVELIVWNRTKGKASQLGVEIAKSPAKLISDVEIIFLCLFDSKAVRAVISEKGGLLEGDCRDKVVIDTTTNHFEEVSHFHRVFKEKMAFYLESPVLGSVIPASQGMLTVLVSGDKTAYERALPLLKKIGKNIFYLEEIGLATKMKLINNLVLGSFMATIAEALSFGEKAGISREMILEILGAGAGNSMVLNAKKKKLLKDDFSTHFSSALMYKDLYYLHDLARAMKSPLFTGSIVKELYGMALAKGLDNFDFSIIYRVLREFQRMEHGMQDINP